MINSPYAKFIIAIVGGVATAALTIFAPHTSGWDVADIVVVGLTAAGVYTVPNKIAA